MRTDRDRMTHVVYRLGDFTGDGRDGEVIRLRAARDGVPPLPGFLKLITDDA